nr:immunoglobulin light chain junction region [Macaca mulatta]MPN86046.1 immunoglobulin light chain junction region [Macaca mulatta]MPN86135.1 immunoglobulin light chain junction region [Macaca mulatta]
CLLYCNGGARVF